MRRLLAPELAELANRVLTEEELRRRLAEPLSEAELAEKLELIEWFTRRYPTAAARLAYARRAYARLVAAQARRSRPP